MILTSANKTNAGLKWILVFLAIGVQKTIAQYTGGNNDGVSFSTYLRVNISDNNAFKGGNNDGYHFALFNKQPLTDAAAFKGGNNDGFAQSNFLRSTITDALAFKGGNDDGFSVSVFNRQNIADATAFKGSNNDGFSVSVFNHPNIADAPAFKGGTDDGFAVAIYLKNTVLPVRLVSFGGQWNAETAVLTWKTSIEENTDKFFIERSFNAHDFYTVGTVAAKGNSNILTTYSFSDTNVAVINGLQKQFFYRLKTVDKNGSYSYSGIIILVKSKSGDFSIIAYPNPAGPFVNVLLQGVSSNQQLTLVVHDVQGKLITQKKNVGTLEKINTWQLRNGQYFISVYDTEKLIKTIPIIIQQ